MDTNKPRPIQQKPTRLGQAMQPSRVTKSQIGVADCRAVCVSAAVAWGHACITLKRETAVPPRKNWNDHVRKPLFQYCSHGKIRRWNCLAMRRAIALCSTETHGLTDSCLSSESLNPRLRLHLRQHLMHEVNRDRSFADGRRHALHIAGSDIPHRKHPRQAGLEKLRRARQRPRLLL